MTNAPTDMQAALVQEFPDVQVFQQFQGDSDVQVARGALRVLLVSVPLVDPFKDNATNAGKQRDSNDIWLALEVGSEFSLPIQASQTVVPDRKNASYTFPSLDVSGAAVMLKLNTGDRSAIQQFEELLVDYCVMPSEQKGQGTLELLDDKGQLLGTIDGPWQLREDPAIHSPGHEKDPVLFELPDQSSASAGTSQQVHVQAVPRDEYGQLTDPDKKDWLLSGATFISNSLQKGSVWAGTKMLKGADAYVARTTPPTSNRTSVDIDMKRGSFSEKNQSGTQLQQGTNLTASGHEVVTFSPQTQNAALKVRDVSGKVCSVSNRTTAALLNAAGNLGDQIGKKTGIQKRTTGDGQTQTPKGFRGALNRSLVAFNVVLDGVTNSAERLIKDGGEASGRMIEHRYGSEAKVISGNVASVGRSAFVVYKDINGVRRKALLKVATGTIRARAPDGGEVVLQQQGVSPGPGTPLSEKKEPTSGTIQPPPYNLDAKQSGTGGELEKKRGGVSDEHIGDVHAHLPGLDFPPTPQRYRCQTAKEFYSSPTHHYDVIAKLTTLNDLQPSEGLLPSSSPFRDAGKRLHETPTSNRVYKLIGNDDFFSSPCANRSRSYSPSGTKQGQCLTYGEAEEGLGDSTWMEYWDRTPPLRASFLCGDEREEAIESLTLSTRSQSSFSSTPSRDPLTELSFEVEEIGIAKNLLCLSNQQLVAHVSLTTDNACFEDTNGKDGNQARYELGDSTMPIDSFTDIAPSSLSLPTAKLTAAGVHAQQRLSVQRLLHFGGDGDGGSDKEVHHGDDGGSGGEQEEYKDKGSTNRGSLSEFASFVEKTAADAAPFSHATFTVDDLAMDKATPTTNEEPSIELRRAQTFDHRRPNANDVQRWPIDTLAVAAPDVRQRCPTHQSSLLTGTVTPRRLSKRYQNGVQCDNLSERKRLDLEPASRMVNPSDRDYTTFLTSPTSYIDYVTAPQRLESVESDLKTERSSSNAGFSSEQPSSPATACFSSPLQQNCKASLPSFSSSFPEEWSNDRTVLTNAERCRRPPLLTVPRYDGSSSPLSSIDDHYVRPKRSLEATDLYSNRRPELPSKRRRIVPRLAGRPIDLPRVDIFTLTAEPRQKSLGTNRSRSDLPPLAKIGSNSSWRSTIERDQALTQTEQATTADNPQDDEGVACILLSLGSNSNLVHEHRALPTERAQRAVRRNVLHDYDDCVVAHKKKDTERKHREKKEAKPRVSKDVIAPYEPTNGTETTTPSTSASNTLAQCGVRELPSDLPKLLTEFPLWYRRFYVPSPMDEDERMAIFGFKDATEADQIKEERLRAAFQRSCRTFPIWKAPDHLLDLYSPRWMRSIGREKEALCPICYEEGSVRFLKTKTSQYNYHLINQHGISPLTRRPFDPPVAFRTVNVPKASSHERQVMLQGECHACRRFIDLQSVRDGQVNVPEIYWWKHTSQCHKRDGTSCESDKIFVKDEIYHKTMTYLSKKSLSDVCASPL